MLRTILVDSNRTSYGRHIVVPVCEPARKFGSVESGIVLDMSIPENRNVDTVDMRDMICLGSRNHESIRN